MTDSVSVVSAARPRADRSDRSDRTYVLDTSVLLADPWALGRFAEHEVVIPLVVLTELEAKRHHPELGWAARETLRMLEDLRLGHGSLLRPMPVNEQGGTLRVEVNHTEMAGFPAALTHDTNDHRILAVARNLAAEGRDVVVVTKDLPLRLKASIVGLEADEYRNELAVDSSWNGVVELDVDGGTIDTLFADHAVDVAAGRQLPCNTGVVLHAGTQSALGRVHDDKRIHLARSDRTLFDVRGRSAEQRIAIDLLADPGVGIVSLGGPAGTGKSVLALAAGLEAVLEQRTHNRVIVFRPIFPVGGQDLGYLPGSESEKMIRGARRSPTPSRRSPARRSSTRCSAEGCSRCCRSPTSAAAASPTASWSSTRRRTSSGPCCSPRSAGWARAAGSCSRTTSPSATTCAWAGTTASSP